MEDPKFPNKSNTVPSPAAPISINSIHEVAVIVDDLLKTYAPSDILVVFDVDMTLTQPDHPATYYPAIKKYNDVLRDIFKDCDPIKQDDAMTATTELPQRLIKKDAPKVVKFIQDKGVKVIAFTANLSGDRDDHKNKTIFKRHDKLQTFGFNFSFAGRVVSYMNFPRHGGGYPMLYHGLLCSNGKKTGKGKVLNAFLDQVGSQKSMAYGSGYVPKVVVVIDDKRSNLKDIETSLNTDWIATGHPPIKFTGITFTGAYDYAPKDISEQDFRAFWEKLIHRSESVYEIAN